MKKYLEKVLTSRDILKEMEVLRVPRDEDARVDKFV
jgi:hypothetical protein